MCDTIVSNEEQLDLLLAEARRIGESVGAKRIEIRCRKTRSEHLPNGWKLGDAWKLHTASLGQSVSALWKGLSRTAIRHLVGRAEAQGLMVTLENDARALDEFYGMFLDTRRGLGLPAVPRHYFKGLLESLSNGGSFSLLARQEGRVVGCILAFRGTR